MFFVLLGFVHFLSFCFTRQRKKKENEPKERKTRLWGLALIAYIGLLGLRFSCTAEALGFSICCVHGAFWGWVCVEKFLRGVIMIYKGRGDVSTPLKTLSVT